MQVTGSLTFGSGNLSTFVQTPLFMIPSVRATENLHIVLWLLKDLCWLMEYRIAGLAMVLPTISVAIFIAWQSRKQRSDLFNALAVICWIAANSTWMISDFFFVGQGHGIAQGLFMAGLGILLFYYAVLSPLDRRRLTVR